MKNPYLELKTQIQQVGSLMRESVEDSFHFQILYVEHTDEDI